MIFFFESLWNRLSRRPHLSVRFQVFKELLFVAFRGENLKFTELKFFLQVFFFRNFFSSSSPTFLRPTKKSVGHSLEEDSFFFAFVQARLRIMKIFFDSVKRLS